MYIHEQLLAQALKRLYMLGNKPYHGGQDGIGNVGLAASGLASQALANVAKHEAAKKAKISGYDTAEGAEEKRRSGEKIGQDLNTARQLMYVGGLMNTQMPGGQYGPGEGPGSF